MAQLVLTPPNAEAPGFLRRQRSSLKLVQRLNEMRADPAVIDEVIAFLLPYITEPTDRAEATEALLDASEVQFREMVAALGGGAGGGPLGGT